MVLKKTNLHDINSGNTMKKSYFHQILKTRASKTTHVQKQLHNIPYHDPKQDGKTHPESVASTYFEDGGLLGFRAVPFWHRHNNTIMYSMNKRKRWLLEDVVSTAMCDQDLEREDFKVTLVHRAVPCSVENGWSDRNVISNVTRYYDSSHADSFTSPNNSFSSRFGLLQKGSKEGQETSTGKLVRKCRRRGNHNLHFRGVQRKGRKRPHEEQRETERIQTEVPEIRYEIAEARKPNSYCTKLEGFYDYFYDWTVKSIPGKFRGERKDYVQWYYPDFCDFHNTLTGSAQTETPDNTEEEDESLCEEYTHTPHEFSLLDLAVATNEKRTRQNRKMTSSKNTLTAATPINRATSKLVRKVDKGEAVFVPNIEQISTDIPDATLESTEEEDADQDSGFLSGEESSNTSTGKDESHAMDYHQDLTLFDGSYSSCLVPEEEFKVRHLQERLGGAVEFGMCVPLTVKFEMRAVSKLLNVSETSQEDFWLLCQAGESSGLDTVNCKKATPINFRLHHGQDNIDLKATNKNLQTIIHSSALEGIISFVSLLTRISENLDKLTVSRPSTKTTTNGPSHSLDLHLPFEAFVKPVSVCTVQEAYHRTVAPEQPVDKETGVNDLQASCSLTWYDEECSVCFSTFGDDAASADGTLTPFLAPTSCGHMFCRQCWQHHLVSCVVAGQTILRCMEYKCSTEVDGVTLLSLVPSWVYDRWQHRVHSRAVESSGRWKWCPNAGCGRLALSRDKRKDNASAEHQSRPSKRGKADTSGQSGVPVVCVCQRRWCLDCGLDSHWPISCSNHRTYVKMLRQNGDEDGLKTTALEITYVSVKKCPQCQYPLEKNGGCSHMQCSQCHCSFCWVCLKLWDQHYSNGWTNCAEKAEETVELDNEKLYPLPIECYRQAVLHRYTWKHLDRQRPRSELMYHTLYTIISKRKPRIQDPVLPSSAVGHISEALVFLQKAHHLLELSYILLSNIPRRQPLARPFKDHLTLLQFSCDRVSSHLQQSGKRVLRTWEALRKTTETGQRQIHRLCHYAHHLTVSVGGNLAQNWLLEGDHERFVHFR